MFNLLPQAEKKALRREYRIRLAVVSLWLLFAVCAISSVLLLPSFLLSSEKEKAARQRFEALSRSIERQSVADLDAVLQKTKSRLTLLSGEAPKLFLYELLTLIVSAKTNQISLTNFYLIGPVEGKREIAIAGVSKDRSALTSFIKALERTGPFEKVEAPISNFAKDTDIDFEVRASGSF